MNRTKVKEINKLVRTWFPDIKDEQVLKTIIRKAKKHYVRSHNGRNERS